jgi:fibronectin-binding autotransporter adhesin
MTVTSRKTNFTHNHNDTTLNWSDADSFLLNNILAGQVAAESANAALSYSIVSWKYNLNGLWSNAAYWTGGAVPGAGNNVLLDTLSSHTITFASGAGTVQALTAVTDLLDVTGGTLSVLGTATLSAGLELCSINNLACELALSGPTAMVSGVLTDEGGDLLVGAGSTLSLTGTANLDGFGDNNGAEIDGAGTMLTSGVTNVFDSYGNGSTGALLGGGLIWNNTGTANVASQIEAGDAFGPGASIVNSSGAIFDFTTDYGSILNNESNAAVTLSNAGTLEKTGGISTSYIYANVINTGLINSAVAAGSLQFDGGGSFGGTLMGPGTIAFAGGASTLTAGAVFTPANLLIDGGVLTLGQALPSAANLSVTSGALVLDDTANVVTGTYTQTGGDVYLSGGKLTVTGANLTYGTLDGPGTFTTQGTTTLSTFYSGGGVIWANTGTVDQTSILYTESNSATAFTLVNAGTYNLQSGSSYLAYASSSALATFTNAGSLILLSGGQVYVDAVLNNTGTISAAAGNTLSIENGGVFGGALTGAGIIDFDSGLSTLVAGAVYSAASLEVTGSGSLSLAANTTPAARSFSDIGGTVYLNGNTLSLASAYLDYGSIEGAGTLTTSGTTSLAAQSSLFLGGNLAWSNTGTVLQASANSVYDDTSYGGTFSLTNAAGAVYDITSNGDFGDSNVSLLPTLQNAGSFAKTGGVYTSNVNAYVTNTGTLTSATGTLVFGEGGLFGGTLNGAGAMAFAGGSATLQAGAIVTIGAFQLDGGALTLAENLTLGNGVFYESLGLLHLGGNTLTVTGATLSGGEIDGPGTLVTSGTTNLSNFYFGSGSTWSNTGTVNVTGGLNDSNGVAPGATIVNQAGAKFNLTVGNSIFSGPGDAVDSFVNNGTFTLVGTANTAYVNGAFQNAGTIATSSNTQALTLQEGGSLGGTMTGNGTLMLSGGNFNLNGFAAASTSAIVINGANAINLLTNDTIAGSFTDAYPGYQTSQGNINLQGFTLALTGAVSLTPYAYYYYLPLQIGGAGGGAFNTSGATTVPDEGSGYPAVQIDSGTTWKNTGAASVGGSIVLDGAINNAAGGTFKFTADDGNLVYDPATNIAGTVINAGLLEKTSGTGTSHIYAAIVDTGTLGTTSGTLELDNGGSISGSIADSSKILLASGSFADGGLTIGGGAIVTNTATVTQAGTLTLGDIAAKVASFVNDTTYMLSAGGSIASTTAAIDVFTNAAGALLEQISGTGRSVLSANIANSGTILAGSGTLALTGTVTGTGALDLGAGATLEIGSNVGTTQSVYFLANSGTLLLDSPGTAKEKIANFTIGSVIDLGNTTATSATLTGTSLLTVYNGATAVATLSLTGTHTGDAYSFASDGHGGTLLGISNNVSTWKGVSADWNTAAGWNQGVPGQQTSASASGTAAYTLSMAAADVTYASTLALSDAKATYTFNGTLNLASTLTLSAGTLNLNGSLYGGTLVASGGTLNIETAYWQNVTYTGGLNLNGVNTSLEIATPLALTGAGADTLSVTGSGATLYLDGVQTPSVTTINLGNNNNYASLISNDPTGNGSLLYLTSAINQVGTYAELSDSGNSNDGVFNEGTLTANVVSGTFSITGDQFENDGSISVGNGDYLDMQSADVVNAGTITSVGSTLELNNLQNAGIINVSDGTLAIDGAFQNTGSATTTNTAVTLNGTLTTAQFAALQGTGDTLNIANIGYFNNTGATLTVGAGSALGQVSLTGTIEGGTIIDLGSGITNQSLATGYHGTLSDVTYDGAFLLGANTAINVLGTFAATGANGLGPGTISIAGSNSGLVFFDNRVVDNVAISLGNTSSISYLSVNDDTGNGATLTLGPNATVTQTGSLADFSYNQPNDTIVNQGSILAQNAGGTLTVGGDGGANGTFTNTGSILVSGGEMLLLNTGVTLSNLTGTTLTAGSFSVGAASLMELSSNATITTDNATITLTGANSQIEALNANTNAQVSLDQKLTKIASAGALSLLGGRNFSASGAFTDGGKLQLGGGTFTASAGLTVSTASLLSGYGKVAAAVTDTGAISASGGTLLFSSAVSGVGTLGAASGATVQLSTGGSLTEALSGAGTLALAGTTAYTLSNTSTKAIGTVAISAGTTLSGSAAFTGGFVDGGQIAVTSGTMSFAGTAGGAGILNLAAGIVLDLKGGGSFSGGVVGGGTLQLDGATPFVLASGGAISAGALLIDAGATLDLTTGGALAGTISGAGTLQLDGTMAYSIANGATLSIGGLTVDAGVALSGAGTITGAVSDAGSITASGGTLVLGSITGAGQLAANVGAVLDLVGGGTLAQQAFGAGSLQLDGTTPYTLQNTAGFSVGTLLVDSGVTLSGTGTISSAVTDSGTIAATGGTLALSGPLTGAGALQIGAGALLQLSAGGTLAEPITGTSGTLELGGTFTQGSLALSLGALIIDAGASLSTTGSLASMITDNGTLIAGSGTLTVAGALTGAGTLSAVSGAVLDLIHGGALLPSITGLGTVKLDGTTPYTLVAGETVSVANLAVDAGVTLSGAGSVTSAISDLGTIAASGGTLALAGPMTGTGPLQVGTGAVLHLSAGGTLNQAVSGLGTLDLGGAYTRGTGALSMSALAIDAGGSFTGTGTLSATIADAGTINAASATLALSGAVTGTGTLAAATGAILDLTHGGALSEATSGAGSLKLDGTTAYILSNTSGFGIAKLLVDSGVTLQGTGTIASVITDAGKIIASGGKLVLGGALTGAGLLQAVASATLDLTAGGTLTNVISGAGTLEIGGAYTLGATVPSMTNLAIDAGGAVTGTGTLATVTADAGLLSAGAGTLKLTKAVSGAGTLSAASGGTLSLSGGGTFTGALSGGGTIAVTTAMVLGGAARLSAATILATANIGVAAGATITEMAGANLVFTASAGQTFALGTAGTESFSNAGTFAASGAGLINEGVSSFTNTGLTSVSGGTLSLLGTVTNSGTLAAPGGLLSVSHLLSGTGTLAIGATGTASLLAGSVAGQVVDFQAGTGALDLTGPTHFAGLIDGFGASDVIDLVNTAETSFTYSGGVLTVLNGSSIVANLNFGGSYTAASFTLGTDGHSGTAISFT